MKNTTSTSQSSSIRSKFPIFSTYPDLHYMDNGATTQRPQIVIEAIDEYYRKLNANVHRGLYHLSAKSTNLFENARNKISSFMGGQDGYVAFTAGATASLNMIAQSLLNLVSEGDYIVISKAEHNSNYLPWLRVAQQTGAHLEYVPLDSENLQITLPAVVQTLQKQIKSPDKLKILALTHCSNVTGNITPIKEIIKAVRREYPNVITVVDGAQSIGHIPVDLKDLDVDFFAFSGHKMYGPMGIGIMWGKKTILDDLDPAWVGGGIVREVEIGSFETVSGASKWEAGTPNVVGAHALGLATEFIVDMDWNQIQKNEHDLVQMTIKMLEKYSKLKILNRNESRRTGIVSFYHESVHTHDIAQILSDAGVAVRAGHHCAQLLHSIVGVGGSVRVSLGMYNTQDDIKALEHGLHEIKKVFKDF